MSLLCNNGPHRNFPLFIWCPQIHTASHFLPRATVLLPLLCALPFLTCFVILTNLSASSSSKVALSHRHSFLDIILRDIIAHPRPEPRTAEVVPMLSLSVNRSASGCHGTDLKLEV